MNEDGSIDAGKPAKTRAPLAMVFVGLVGMAGFIALMVSLAKSCGEGDDLCQRFAMDVRAGQRPKLARAAKDHVRVLDAIAQSKGVSIGNFEQISTNGRTTACFWGSLEMQDGTRDIGFLMEEIDGKLTLVGVSVDESCTCEHPDGDEHCAFYPR